MEDPLSQQGVLKVKKSYLSVAFATCAFVAAAAWLATSAQPAMAQNQQAFQVYLVDVALIFKNDPNLKAQMTQMQHDIEAIQKDLNTQTDQLKEHAERLKTLNPGTPDYHAMEESLVKEKAGIQGTMQLRKKDMALREARIYFNAYTTIHEEVRALCESRGFPLVLTFNSEKINPENPDEVLRAINGKVLYNTPAIDLTPYIMERIKRVPTASQNNSFMPQNVGPAGNPNQPMPNQNPNGMYQQPRP